MARQTSFMRGFAGSGLLWVLVAGALLWWAYSRDWVGFSLVAGIVGGLLFLHGLYLVIAPRGDDAPAAGEKRLFEEAPETNELHTVAASSIGRDARAGQVSDVVFDEKVREVSFDEVQDESSDSPLAARSSISAAAAASVAAGGAVISGSLLGEDEHGIVDAKVVQTNGGELMSGEVLSDEPTLGTEALAEIPAEVAAAESAPPEKMDIVTRAAYMAAAAGTAADAGASFVLTSSLDAGSTDSSLSGEAQYADLAAYRSAWPSNFAGDSPTCFNCGNQRVTAGRCNSCATALFVA